MFLAPTLKANQTHNTEIKHTCVVFTRFVGVMKCLDYGNAAPCEHVKLSQSGRDEPSVR